MTNTASIDGGVMAAVLTPLDADIAPDHGRWLDHCRNLLEQGCTGLAVLGTTSEANSFSVSERLDMLDALGSSDIDAGLSVPGSDAARSRTPWPFVKWRSISEQQGY